MFPSACCSRPAELTSDHISAHTFSGTDHATLDPIKKRNTLYTHAQSAKLSIICFTFPIYRTSRPRGRARGLMSNRSCPRDASQEAKGRHLLGTSGASLCDSPQSSCLQGLRGSQVKSTDTQPSPAALDHFLQPEKHPERKASDKSLEMHGFIACGRTRHLTMNPRHCGRKSRAILQRATLLCGTRTRVACASTSHDPT